ncbi:MAG: PRC-barrel domain-containing protein [Steroidobacteraceae bacterium]|nr:PRC-barrel domain-containing protein [Steroidobacteraceae bacterium]
MAKLRSVSFLIAASLAGAAYVQTPDAPPDPADTQASPPSSTEPTAPTQPEGASSRHQRDATDEPGSESRPAPGREPQSASNPPPRGAVGETPSPGAEVANGAHLVGLEVQSPQGESLGAVIDLTMDPSGEPEYVVISTGPNTATAVPYATAALMAEDDRIVMDRTKLQNSPQVAKSEIQDRSNTKWRSEADRYWGGTIRSASPGDSSRKNEPTRR